MLNSTKILATDAEIRGAMDQILALDIALTEAISKLDLICFASENDDPIFSIFPHSNINWRKINMLKIVAVKELHWIKYHLERCEILKEEYLKIINLEPVNRFNLYFSKHSDRSFISFIKNTFTNSPVPKLPNLMDGIVEFDKYLKQRLLNAFLINSDLSLKLPRLDIAKSVLPLNSFYCLTLPVKNYPALGGSIRCTWGGDKYTRKISTFAACNLLSTKEKTRKGFIYGGVTVEDGQWYVGQTTQLPEKRFLQHRIDRTGPYRQGTEKVNWMVLEADIEDSKLNERERFWIEEKNARHNGHNRTSGNT